LLTIGNELKDWVNIENLVILGGHNFLIPT
jgi:hypothetical protein